MLLSIPTADGDQTTGLLAGSASAYSPDRLPSISTSECSEPGVWNDDAGTDLFVALLQFREDLIRPATEV